MANKNSTYLTSLVSFIEDTKPYHSKLTEIIEEYRFFDTMTVNMHERTFDTIMSKAAWSYSYFSGGISTPAPTLPVHRLVSPLFSVASKNNTPSENRGAFSVLNDQNTDLPLVPFAFDPRSFQGVGIADAFVQRSGIAEQSEPLLEGHDFFQSHGAYVFSIKQTVANGGAYSPMFTARPNEGLISAARAATIASAHDTTNPYSSVRRIGAVLDLIAAQLVLTPSAGASAALTNLRTQLAIPSLPSSYEALLNSLVNDHIPIIAGYTGWVGADISPPYTDKYVNLTLSAFTPDLYFNLFSDLGIRESGSLSYDNVSGLGIDVINITVDPTRVEYEEWVLEAATLTTFVVRGSKSGIVGYAVLGTTFSTAQVTFTTVGSATLTPGDRITLTPRAKITIHKDAALEAWSLIKVNPLAYSRPQFISTRYGSIEDLDGILGRVTILDPAFKTGILQFTCINSTTFSIKSSTDSSVTGTATVGAPYNDGALAFTIINGSEYQFRVGDKFIIEVSNDPPSAEDLDLYYGYDLDSYDANELRYNLTNSGLPNYLTTLDFGFDSRFTTYDLTSFNLTIAQNAIKDRQWRLRARPNMAAPLAMQNTNPGVVNELQTNDPTNPNAPTQFDMPNDAPNGPASGNDPNTTADLNLYYAQDFALEYLNSNTGAWIFVDPVALGATYNNTTEGLSFTLVPAAKPFISGVLHSSAYNTATSSIVNEDVIGGDVISWTIRNKEPIQANFTLVSARVPRLVMHGDSFHDSVPAKWTLLWTSDTEYTITGFQTVGGDPIAPITVQTAAGRSFRNDVLGLHFTVQPGLLGVKSGDSFSFETYESKPTFLVHGSVSGWMPEAEIGKWYFNGKIGFKLKAPEIRFFNAGVEVEGKVSWTPIGGGTITLDRIRNDTPSGTYVLRSYSTNHWCLFRNGTIVADGATQIRDKYLWLTLPAVTAGTSYTLMVTADTHELALGNDLAIVRTTAGRMPTSSDFVLVERTKSDALTMSIKSLNSTHSTLLARLGPSTTDVRFVDHTTGSGVPLENTSPETAILNGWIPTLITRRDGTTTAEFSDPSTSAIVRAAGTGEVIGTIESIGSTPAEPVIFRWNSAFHATYMPLNSEATFVLLGSGMDERANVNLTEGAQFLISGGALAGEALFSESISIPLAQPELLPVPAGYDNLPYDWELGTGDINDGAAGGGASYDLSGADAEVRDSLTIYETDSGTHTESVAFIYTITAPGLPGMPDTGQTYADFKTPLMLSPSKARILVSFATPFADNVVFYTWVPGAAAPVLASNVEKLNNHLFRFDGVVGSEVKIIALGD